MIKKRLALITLLISSMAPRAALADTAHRDKNPLLSMDREQLMLLAGSVAFYAAALGVNKLSDKFIFPLNYAGKVAAFGINLGSGICFAGFLLCGPIPRSS